MADAVRFELDTREFTRALTNYAAATGKDLPHVVNRSARNLAFKTLKAMPTAKPGSIPNVEEVHRLSFWEFWPKHISQVMVKVGWVGWGHYHAGTIWRL